MALFLNEAYEQHTGTGVGTMESFQEAAFALLDLANQQAALNEGILIADYILDRQCQNLSEGETTDKMKDFGRKVAHNIKAFALTVWAKIKEIVRLVWRKLKEWGSKVLDMIGGKEVEINKTQKYRLEEIPRIAEKMLNLVERGFSTGAAEGISEKVAEVKKEYETVRDASKGAEKEKVGKNWLKSVASSVGDLAKKLDKAADKMKARSEELEKLNSKIRHSDNKEDSKDSTAGQIKSLQTSIASIQTVAGWVANEAGQLSKITGTPVKDDK